MPFRALQVGDERCNRTTDGFYVGADYFPILDDEDPADVAVRDAFLSYFGGISFSGTPGALLLAKMARVVARHPGSVALFVGWLARTGRTIGVRRLLRHRHIRLVTFGMHSFMDAADVAPAWQAMQHGQISDDARIAETQQRLAA